MDNGNMPAQCDGQGMGCGCAPYGSGRYSRGGCDRPVTMTTTVTGVVGLYDARRGSRPVAQQVKVTAGNAQPDDRERKVLPCP